MIPRTLAPQARRQRLVEAQATQPAGGHRFAEGAGVSNEGEAGAVKSGMGGQMSVSDVRRVLDAGVLAR
jgi:hypothetical protein